MDVIFVDCKTGRMMLDAKIGGCMVGFKMDRMVLHAIRG